MSGALAEKKQTKKIESRARRRRWRPPTSRRRPACGSRFRSVAEIEAAARPTFVLLCSLSPLLPAPKPQPCLFRVAGRSSRSSRSSSRRSFAPFVEAALAARTRQMAFRCVRWPSDGRVAGSDDAQIGYLIGYLAGYLIGRPSQAGWWRGTPLITAVARAGFSGV